MPDKKQRNVLITSIIGDESRKNIEYFYFRDGQTKKIGSRIARSEAAVYRLLSQIRLDEIIAVGNDGDINENDVTEEGVLTDNLDYMKPNTDELSDYSFFRYRLCQFIDGIDLETLDINDAVPIKRQKKLKDVMQRVLGEDLSRGFTQIQDDYSLLENIYKEAVIEDDAEKAWIKRYLFCNIREENRIKPLEQNKKIKISFLKVVTDRMEEDMLSNINKLMELLAPGKDEEINIYVDVQALSIVDAYVLLNYLKTLDIDTKNDIYLKDISSLNYKKNTIAQKLTDASERFRVSEFTTGIDVFIKYGKANLLKNYWRKTGEQDPYIDELLYAMSKVDTGISLCNNDEIIEGIRMFVGSMNKLDSIQDVDLGSEAFNFIYQVRNSVMRDYAGIMNEDGSLNLLKLIKWEYAKGFYQQVLTMIESRTSDILAENGVLYFAENEEEKQKIIDLANKAYWTDDPRFRHSFDNMGHWIVKNLPHDLADYRQHTEPKNLKFANVLIDCLEPGNKYGLQLHSLTEDREGLRSLLLQYFDMGATRNKINHALNQNGAEADEVDFTGENPMLAELSGTIKKFISDLEKLVDGVKGKTFTSLNLDSEEAYAYFREHRVFEDRNEKNRDHNKGRNDFHGRNNKSGENGHCTVKNSDGREIHIHIHID